MRTDMECCGCHAAPDELGKTPFPTTINGQPFECLTVDGATYLLCRQCRDRALVRAVQYFQRRG